MNDSFNPAHTPADHRRRPSSAPTAPQQYSWYYSSVVGLILWIAFNTHPNIEFAASMASRSIANSHPKHYKFIYRNARYLLRTRDKGILLRPELTNPKFEVFIDSDFAGDFDAQAVDVDTNSKLTSLRSGYLLCFSSVSLLWVMKLQSETALSTTETEYIALSQSLHDAIPSQDLFREIGSALSLSILTPAFQCAVFEGNNGALPLATAPKMRPRTKHIAVKNHQFRERITSKTISIHKITTAHQRADLLTNPLPLDPFCKLRSDILGW